MGSSSQVVMRAGPFLRRHLPFLLGFPVLCAFTLALSLPHFNASIHPQTAHVLSSMRAFDERGFFALRGISSLLASSPELPNANAMELLKSAPYTAYLSYPPGWLWLPYGAYRAWHFVVPSSQVGPLFLESYGIVVNRFLTLVLLYALVWELGAAWNLKAPVRSAASLFGCAFWVLPPAVLSMTQNAYGMDEAMLPWITAMMLLLARCRCDPSSRPKERWILAIVSFLCCFVDWYGLVITGVAMLACVTQVCINVRGFPVRRMAVAALPFLAGAAVAGGIFAVQLAIFAPGLSMLEQKYAIRSGMPFTVHQLLTYLKIHWLRYLPRSTQLAGIALIVASSAAGIMVLRRERSYAALFAALVLPPVIWTALLPEHTYSHDFSVLKFSIPTATGAALCMFWLASQVQRRTKDSATATTILLLMLTAGLCVHMAKTASYGDYDRHDISQGQWRAEVLNGIGAREIPLSRNGEVLGLHPAERAWFSTRMIYSPETLRALLENGEALWADLAKREPVWIATKKSIKDTDLAECAGKWKAAGGYNQVRVFTCRDASLRALYAPGSGSVISE